VKGGPSVPDSNAPSWAAEFNALTAATNFTQAGAVVPTIMLLDENGALYIHGKAIVADGVDGWFGSINASSGSMNTNRELGIGVTNRSAGSTPYIPAAYSPQMIAAVTSSAATDSAAGTSWAKAQPQPTTKSSAYLASAQFPCINTTANAVSGLPARDPNNVAVPPQAPVTPPAR
jgi:phosphatidylserine/phosphatidylglycerophosphate/cardiolipin synthase-like enzyme